VQLDPIIGWSGGEEVDDAHRCAIVVPRDEGEPHSLAEEGRGHLDQIRCLHDGREPMEAD
jgi:hypothetical protein